MHSTLPTSFEDPMLSLSGQMKERTILRYNNKKTYPSDDNILVEMPLSIILNSVHITTLECTPGNDVELALGFCITEQFITPEEDVRILSHTQNEYGIQISFSVEGGESRTLAALQDRQFHIPNAYYKQTAPQPAAPLHFAAKNFFLSPEKMYLLQTEAEAWQTLFNNTGATHFCALFDEQLSLIAYSEDVGRHNALDKSIGQTKQLGTINSIRLIMLSSRVTHEIVRKSSTVTSQIIAGFSAVTTAAIAMADRSNRTLIGFLRKERMNIYTHEDRLGFSAPRPELQPVHNLSRFIP